ncbi:MAG: hypothetical protein LLF28_01770 [Nitrospiraceae bacterium]|nr:hypothetical protein [Nitrospiraceae bacterium]
MRILKNLIPDRYKKQIAEFRKKIKPYLPESLIIKKIHIKKLFLKNVGYFPDIDSPKSLNEKIQWLKLYYQDDLITKCSDKYIVREYVKQTIGEEFLVRLLGVYDDSDDVDFDKLPDKFVLKANNSSGSNIFCENKSIFDIYDAKEKMKSWLNPRASHYYYLYEWCYKNIKPRIICEEFIEDKEDGDLKDYKIMCFNGQVKIISVCYERAVSLGVDYFDLEWNQLPFKRFNKNIPKKIKKPENLDLMIEIAEKLSKPFPFVRVDLYHVNNKIFFGELTFHPGSGVVPFDPVDWDYKLGSMLVLPDKKILE